MMLSVDELLEQAKRLKPRELKRLTALLEKHLSASAGRNSLRREALYSHTLKLAGAGHSDGSDVSSNKGKYLGDVYATKR